jgi:hypothetical protein
MATRQNMPFCVLLAAIAEKILPEQNGGSVRVISGPIADSS